MSALNAAAHAISPLDGRYAGKLQRLSAYFSEYALVRSRLAVEVAHAFALDALQPKAGGSEPKAPLQPLFSPLLPEEAARLEGAVSGFDAAAFAAVKAHEATTKHDVKAVEYHLRAVADLREPNRVHFGLTSEDVNNLAYSANFLRFRDEQQLTAIDGLLRVLAREARAGAALPFPARTHGQPATPTTAGKELAVFASRLLRCRENIAAHVFFGKLNGASGTHAALMQAEPAADWRAHERRVVEGLGLRTNRITTQVEDHDAWARWFHETRLLTSVLVDLCRDVWLYISNGWIVQRVAAGEVGSSTMPHKVNPIRFENAEGNLELASALLAFLAEKLTRSRMQRDLSDSTVTRNIGVAMGHLILALDEITAGFGAISVNAAACRAAVEAAPEVLAEPIQTVMRLSTAGDPYAELRDRTRGQAVTAAGLASFVSGLDLPADRKERLVALRPETYLGDAAELALEVAAEVERSIGVQP
jgi:adenylosuccinate lyase